MAAMTRSLDVAACRARFPSLARELRGQAVVYLDGPAGSQLPATVADAVRDAMIHRSANAGGAFVTSREVDALVVEARAAAADLLGAESPDAIAFGPNMTTLTFALSRAVARTWEAGDEVVVTQLDHDANVTPWVLAARDAGALVRTVPIHAADCTLDVDALARALGPRTRLVAVTAASNLVGTLTPIGRIAELVHAAGALLAVDAVHYAAHARIDVRRWDADFVVFSPYKLFGPHLGVLWGRRELMDQLPAYKVRPASDATGDRWMTGTPPFELLAGFAASVEYLASLGGDALGDRRGGLDAAFDAIGRHESDLAWRLVEGLRDVGFRIVGIDDARRAHERLPTVACVNDRVSPSALHEQLARDGIFTWAGHSYAVELAAALGLRDGVLRLGILHYNTAAEIDRTLHALERAVG